ncbi:MAG: hypothetical protein HZA19_02005 [Nitrospirae bacterium]|nr:hypothetical protein [Nitrospirota bacterium]
MSQPGVSRCLFHVGTGLVLTVLVFFVGKEAGLWWIGSFLALAVAGEVLRFRIPALNRLFVQWVGPVLKMPEREHPTGIGYFLGGIWITLLICDLEITLASMIILAVGDPAAAYVGRRWGRLRFREKSLEGTLGFLVCSLAAGWVFQGMGGYTVPLFALGAVTGAVVEFLPLKIDDNLILPVAAGFAMQAAAAYF